MARFLSREDLLTIRYATLQCPDAGEIRLLPYVSHGAIASFASFQGNPKAALNGLVRASIPEADSTGLSLTNRDLETIARFYASFVGCQAEFDAAFKTDDVFTAFSTAILASESWKQFQDSRERAERSLRFTLDQHLARAAMQCQRETDLVRRIERDFARVELSTIEPASARLMREADCVFRQYRQEVESARQNMGNYVSKRQELESYVMRQSLQRSAAELMDAQSYKMISRSREIADFVYKAEAELAKLNRIVETGEWKAARVQDIELRAQWNCDLVTQKQRLTEYVKQAVDIRNLADPIGRLSRDFGWIANELQTGRTSPVELCGLANKALLESVQIVDQAGEIFARPRVSVSPMLAYSPIITDESYAEVAKIDCEIEAVSTRSQYLLHDGTARTIVAGNETAITLREIVGTAIDERLTPFKGLLDRLTLLSTSPAFLDSLTTFAATFSRDHWRSMWRAAGKTFVANPESQARLALSMFLHGRWQGIAFVGQELGNGDGFVDLLVNFLGVDYIVELKVVGATWSIGEAKKGLKQLDDYMMNYRRQEAFLVVFDGRTTSRGEQFEAEYRLTNGIVKVVTVRVHFEAPSRR